jgi:hypothetical protein
MLGNETFEFCVCVVVVVGGVEIAEIVGVGIPYEWAVESTEGWFEACSELSCSRLV